VLFRSLVIARSGAIYYSQSAAIGRVDVDGTVDDAFATLPRSARQVWGIVPNEANTHLYVGSPSTGAIYDVDVTMTPPAVSTLVSGVGGPNGLTLGPDGALYFSDFSGGRVLRVALDGSSTTPTLVANVPSANGVAFDDAGRLLVCNYGSGQLVRLTLSAGVESAREMAASGLGSPDGVALDRDGTIHVTDNGRGRLLRVEADGSTTTLLMGVPQAASLDFGAGALDCEDIYVASGGTLFRYEMGTVAGRDVLWH
jgi:sugar lactone lactonase YvrE